MRVILIAVLCVCLNGTTAYGELGWGFKSPAFHYGNGYSTHVLSVEQLQHNRSVDMQKQRESEIRAEERDADNTILSKFMRNLESRIYATMSKQMVDAMFATCDAEDTSCIPPSSGTADIEGAVIAWAKDPDTGELIISIDGEDGFTEIKIPGMGEFAF